MIHIPATVHELTPPGSQAEQQSYYCMFSRHGGVSEGVYSSLNIGCNVGDHKKNVECNRERLRQTLRLKYLLSADQVHGTEIFCLENQPSSDLRVVGYDALLTDQIGVGLMIQHADCQAVLLFDPVNGVAGAVHSGWRGSVKNILGQVVETMVSNYGTDPKNIEAVISPSLGPCCAEFINHKTELPEEFTPYMVSENHFDFWAISQHQLGMCGVEQSSIKTSGTCTACSEDYFSYRRACRESGGITGRNCSVIVLQK